MSAATSTVGLLAIGTGVGLVYAAVTGQSPIDELRKALTLGTLDGRPDDASIRVDPVDVDGSFQSVETARQLGNVAGGLVPIGQGSHKLTGPAAAAFKRAEQMYGRSITVTDSYRSPTVQAKGRASDPDRFGTAESSGHVRGTAVDVNLPALGLSPKGSNPSGWLNDPAYRKLYDAMTRAGFCNYQIRNGTTKGRTPEPWHFNYGDCR